MPKKDFLSGLKLPELANAYQTFCNLYACIIYEYCPVCQLHCPTLEPKMSNLLL
jgi:hypothetical protein